MPGRTWKAYGFRVVVMVDLLAIESILTPEVGR
jgi:hypothetical protein